MTALPRRRSTDAFIILVISFAVLLAGCTNRTNGVAGNNPSAQAAPPSAASPQAAPAPSPQPQPVPQPAKGLTLPKGTRIEVRLNQTIDVKHVSAGDHFTGSLAEPVTLGSIVAVPSGSGATGEVLVAHRRGRFKGRSVMALTLTGLEVNGIEYRIDTNDLSRTKKGKGRRSAALIGGGAGMGMLIGGLATGGVGLLVGGLAGGGAGALGAAFTGNRDLSLPAESVVAFHLQNELTLQPETQASLSR